MTAAVCLIIGKIRNNWYDNYLSALDASMATMMEKIEAGRETSTATLPEGAETSDYSFLFDGNVTADAEKALEDAADTSDAEKAPENAVDAPDPDQVDGPAQEGEFKPGEISGRPAAFAQGAVFTPRTESSEDKPTA